jgi:prepilin-type N-terminal cleavage/methylation domain-containing protein
MVSRVRKAFTLVELLIVVAIIAILAAIAVPNFLEAQTRSKVARVKNDLRTMATAIESYVVDWNTLPRDNDSDLDREPAMASYEFSWKANGAVQLTTPIAYLSSFLQDPFSAGRQQTASYGAAVGYRIGSGTWSYGSTPGSPQSEAPADSQGAFAAMQAHGPVMAYVVLSPGPTGKRQRMGYKCFPWKSPDPSEQNPYVDYDPTNGTVSSGDIYRFGGQWLSGNWDRLANGNGPLATGAN